MSRHSALNSLVANYSTKFHTCKLKKRTNLLDGYINSGSCLEFRKKFRWFLLVSEKHPFVNKYIKSSAALRKERERHLDEYYHMIHPLSMARMVWEIFMGIILLISFIIIPAWITETVNLTKIKFALDVIFFCDMFVTFRSGYTEQKSKQIILDEKKVSKKYFKSLFVFDLVSSWNLDVIPLVKKKIPWISYLTMLKLVRMPTFFKYLHLCLEYKKWHEVYPFVKVFFVSILFAWFLCCCICTIALHNRQDPNSWAYDLTLVDDSKLLLFVHSWYRGLYISVLVGYGVKPSKILLDIILEIIGLTVGFFLQAYILAIFFQVTDRVYWIFIRYNKIVQQLQTYMRFKELPKRLCKRITLYIEYRFTKKLYKYSDIKNMLTAKIHEEIIMSSRKELLLNVEYFRDLPNELLVQLALNMKYDCFLPNDIIIETGVFSSTMYFIKTGTVAVYSRNGKEVCHLEDKSYFGELALVKWEQERIATVVALVPCHVYTLNERSFLNIMKMYPDYYNSITTAIIENMKEGEVDEEEEVVA